MTRLHTSAHVDVTSTLLSRIGRIGRAFTRTQPLNETRNQRTPQELLTYATDVVDQLTGAAQCPCNALSFEHTTNAHSYMTGQPTQPSEVAALHESFTQSWGELALAAHGRGEHEGRRYSLVCPACRAA